MCGIAGIYNFEKTVSEAWLKKMTDIMEHRGPDDEGFYVKDNIGLGHRRLSIIDLSSQGHQPMSNEDESLWIVYNGEIYNFIDLHNELEKRGHVFKSNTDTEVVLHSFEEWGFDCLNRFNGMWAFAIWDVKKKQLFCSRDRFGVKPFYYFFNGITFAFASEIKALISCPFIKKEPNEKAIHSYLLLMNRDYGDATFFSNIKQIEPSHYLLVDSRGIKINRYYQLPFNSNFGEFQEKKADKYSQQFMGLIEDSVRLRLQSEVSIGSNLSGGLDSSAIVCLINRLLQKKGVAQEVIGRRQKTFSSCFEDARFDERKYIEKIFTKINIDSHYVFPSSDNLWREMDNLIYHQEEPFISTSIYAQWCVMKLAKENGVKVVLDGQGADELFGYPPQISSYFIQMILSGEISHFLEEFNKSLSTYSISNLGNDVLNRFLRYYLPRKLILSLRKTAIKNLNFIRKDFVSKYKYDEITSRHSLINLQNTLHEGVMKHGLRTLLNYEDKNSMAHSMEARVPFLDYRLVEFVFSLPAAYKIHGGWTKYLLRRAVKDMLPQETCWRRDKMGFVTSEIIWLRETKNTIKDIFRSDNFQSRDYVDRKKILNNIDQSLYKKDMGLSELWRFINLELWLRRFF